MIRAAMIQLKLTQTPPLIQEANGTVRITGSRVTLDTIIWFPDCLCYYSIGHHIVISLGVSGQMSDLLRKPEGILSRYSCVSILIWIAVMHEALADVLFSYETARDRTLR